MSSFEEWFDCYSIDAPYQTKEQWQHFYLSRLQPERAETHNASTVLMWCRNQEITNKRFSIPDKQSIHLQREVPSPLPKSPPSHFCVVVLHWFVWDFAPYRFRKHFSRFYTASKKCDGQLPTFNLAEVLLANWNFGEKNEGKNFSWR